MRRMLSGVHAINRNYNKMRWSENVTYEFVKIYMSHELLWNSEHTNHRLKSKRLIAYREIIAALNDKTGILLNEPELKNKIKNLRSTYAQELLKIKQRSGTYTPNMKWFMVWHKRVSSLKNPIEDSSFDNQQDITEDPCPKIWQTDNLEEETLDPFPEADDDYNLILKSEPREDPNMKTDRAFQQTTNRYETKKKKIKHRRPSSDCSIFSSTESITKEDEFDIYGKYIASQLRKMDLQKALRVQLEIHSLVSEARISDLKEEHALGT